MLFFIRVIIKFKTVTKQDIPILLQLIKELAQYEHLLHDLSIHFYQKQGAIPMSDWTVYRLSEEELKNLL